MSLVPVPLVMAVVVWVVPGICTFPPVTSKLTVPSCLEMIAASEKSFPTWSVSITVLPLTLETVALVTPVSLVPGSTKTRMFPASGVMPFTLMVVFAAKIGPVVLPISMAGVNASIGVFAMNGYSRPLREASCCQSTPFFWAIE